MSDVVSTRGRQPKPLVLLRPVPGPSPIHSLWAGTKLVAVFGIGVLLTFYPGWVPIALVAALVAVVAAGSVLASIYNSMNERRRQIAILRALGARRRDLVWVLMAESASLATAGAVLGLALGHLAAATIASWLPAAAPLAGAAWRFVPAEGVVVALAIAGGILAACWPAWRASRLDVAATLADS